ncbi:hypothetical protein P7E15_16560 [Enterococcus gallinarum]|nr:hypothetical protein [Enterococcus gallinarum]
MKNGLRSFGSSFMISSRWKIVYDIAYNVVHNHATFIEGFGIPLRNGKRPYWIKDEEEVNEHINVIYNSYETDVDFE